MKSRQEQQLKVRHFLPPLSAEPEIFILGQDGGIFSGSMGGSSAPSKLFLKGPSHKKYVCGQVFKKFNGAVLQVFKALVFPLLMQIYSY